MEIIACLDDAQPALEFSGSTPVSGGCQVVQLASNTVHLRRMPSDLSSLIQRHSPAGSVADSGSTSAPRSPLPHSGNYPPHGGQQNREE